ncbi:hypothetical protein ACFSTE_08445 [Aquimarina hainanensis]|uniref:Uncharacterized protein n=1 Tax=Aquimarina hainanensis TaxID=1578017 RepID=A0ABW5N5F1_9FLAO|nr:hypothetical protein [Aquimarina sp. TRL1]QKX03976.1 hypothetical protein HN014_03335 [Aquimarina sp. TRL1]
MKTLQSNLELKIEKVLARISTVFKPEKKTVFIEETEGYVFCFSQIEKRN